MIFGDLPTGAVFRFSDSPTRTPLIKVRVVDPDVPGRERSGYVDVSVGYVWLALAHELLLPTETVEEGAYGFFQPLGVGS